MLKIKKRFIVNEKNEPVEVVLDLKTFEKIEEMLEDHLFGRILEEADKASPVPLEEAKQRYVLEETLMNWTVLVAPQFLKDLARLPAKVRGRIEDFVFEALPAADNPFGVGKIEKLKGHSQYFKVRFGDYRVGLKIDTDQKQVVFLRVLHRRDIYRHFP